MNSPQLKILNLYKNIYRTRMRVCISNIFQWLLMAFVNSFRISQLYISYTLILVSYIQNNFLGCIVSCYTALVNNCTTIHLYSQSCQSITSVSMWNTFSHLFYDTFHNLWFGPKNNLWNVCKISSIMFYSTLTSFFHTLIRRPCTLYIVQLLELLFAELTN
jgi:hypothetical protein